MWDWNKAEKSQKNNWSRMAQHLNGCFFKVISQAAHDRKLKKNTFFFFLINAFYAVKTASDVLILQILKLSFSVIIPYVFIISPYHQSIFIHIYFSIRHTNAVVGLLSVQSLWMGFWWCLLFWEEENCQKGGSSFILFAVD